MATAARVVGLKHGFRSGLEESLASRLTALGIPFEFESRKVEYVQPEKNRKYTPDFWIPYRNDPRRFIVIESKGIWDTEDRQKHLLVHEQRPDLDIRFVFSNANQRISKQSSTTYAMYCDRQGWLWAHRTIPTAWLTELGYEVSIQ